MLSKNKEEGFSFLGSPTENCQDEEQVRKAILTSRQMAEYRKVRQTWCKVKCVRQNWSPPANSKRRLVHIQLTISFASVASHVAFHVCSSAVQCCPCPCSWPFPFSHACLWSTGTHIDISHTNISQNTELKVSFALQPLTLLQSIASCLPPKPLSSKWLCDVDSSLEKLNQAYRVQDTWALINY